MANKDVGGLKSLWRPVEMEDGTWAIEGLDAKFSGMSKELATHIAEGHNRRFVVENKGAGNDIQLMQALFSALQDLHTEFYSHLSRIGEDVKAKKYKKEILVDLGFICRESEDMLDDWRKTCKAWKEYIGKLIAFMVLQNPNSVNDPNATDTVHGTLAYGVVNMEVSPNAIPHNGTAEYDQLCDHFEIPQEVRGNNLIKFSWDQMRKHVTQCAADGKQPPPGITTRPDYSTTFTRKSRTTRS